MVDGASQEFLGANAQPSQPHKDRSRRTLSKGLRRSVSKESFSVPQGTASSLRQLATSSSSSSSATSSSGTATRCISWPQVAVPTPKASVLLPHGTAEPTKTATTPKVAAAPKKLAPWATTAVIERHAAGWDF